MSAANPYAVLGVPEDASTSEIKTANRRQMRLAAVDAHPDACDVEHELLQQRMVEVNRAYYLRQLRDLKGSADVDNMTAPLMTAYSKICGATLARAHTLLGDRIAIPAYLGTSDTFDRAIADFSGPTPTRTSATTRP